MDGKKRMKNINKRLLIIFLIISAIISASLGIKAYARATSVPIEVVSEDAGTSKTAWFSCVDLDTYWYILCCQHGTTISMGNSGNNNIILSGSYSEGSFSLDVSTTIFKTGDTLYYHTNTDASNDFDADSYKVNTYGLYHVIYANYVTNPAESYIIAEANPTNAGSHNNSAVQKAWWNTYMGHVVTGGSTGTNNALNQEAVAFQSYICKLLGIADPGQTTEFDTSTYYTTQTYYIEETGETGTITAPNISYDAAITAYQDGDTTGTDVDKNGTINDADKVTVSYEESTNSYLIGPFTVDYVEAGVNDAKFATITSAVLKTNVGDSVILGTGEADRSSNPESITYSGNLSINTDINWKFRFVANTSVRTDGDTYEFPHSGEVFYIEIEYVAGMTEIEGLEFEFKYLNAGGLLNLYKGSYYSYTWTAQTQVDTVYYNVYDSYTGACVAYNTTNVSGYSSNRYDIDVSYTTYNHWLECETTTVTSQALGYVLQGVRWYQYTSTGIEVGSIKWSTITIEKTTVNDDGDKVNVDDTFSFTIYIDKSGGTNYTEFETITVTTENGKGSATTTAITWEGNTAPSYKIVEVNKDGYTTDGPWTGSLSQYENKSVTIQATNYVEPYSGKIEVDKRLVNSSAALESETFTFEVVVTGTFSYNGGEIKTYTGEEFKLTVTIKGAGEWTSEEFEWWDSSNAPKYTIKEVIEEDADYECVSTNPKTGTVYDREDPTVVTFYNQSIEGSYLHVDKKIVNETAPEDDESFKVNVTITGTFEYGGVQYTNETLEINDIILDKSNNWTWDSEYITWKTTKAPTFTVQEDLDYMADYYKFNSIQGSTSNDYSSRLTTGDTYVTVTNEKTLLSGNIVINKIATTEDISGQSFDFTVLVTGKFSYNGGEIQTYTDENPLTLTASVVADGDSWVSGTFTWYDTEENPKYTVTEGELPDGVSFVSISNGTSTVTNSRSISGTINGGENSTETVTIICKNQGTIEESEEGKIKIVKMLEGNTESTDVFTFNVTISGTFTYVDENGNVLNKVENGTLTFSNDSDADYPAITITGSGEWVSETIKWDTLYGVPTYKIEEVNIPDDATFDHWDVKTGTLQTKSTGTVSMTDGLNVATAVNKVEEQLEGYITLKKISGNDPLNIVTGDTFTFTIKVYGNKFLYDSDGDGVQEEYTNSNPLELTVSVIADGDTWVSEKFTWYESDGAPTYEVQEQLTEEQSNNGVKLEYIKNESGSSTSSTTWLAGTIPSGGSSSNIICSNGVETITYSGKVRVYKYLYDSVGNEVDGSKFTFKLIITYADGTTSTIPFTITSGSSWTSDTIYWGSGEAAPTYEVQETTKSGYTVEKTNATGSLINNETVKVYFRNYSGEKDKWGKLSITKNVINEDKVSMSDQVSVTFTFNVTVTGDFTYKNNESGEYSYYTSDGDAFTYTVKITAGETWESGTFYWYDDAPTYSIEEINLPTGYSLVSMDSSCGTIAEGVVTSVQCTNQVGSGTAFILTMELGGKVWDDTDDSDGKIADVGENGKIDEGESGIEGVKVTVYRVFVDSNGNIVGRSSDVYAYDENDNVTRIDNYTYTDSSGNWSFGSVSVPAFVSDSEEAQYSGCSVSYDVEFSYDGQTYEPTTFLENSENYGIGEYDITGKSSQFVNSSTATRDEWLYDSTVIDDESERANFNNKFANIEGGTAMDSNGNTVGTATGSGTDITLNYSSTDSVSILNSDNTRKVSTLETYDENGDIYSDFLIDSRTSTGALTYPFDSNIHLTSWDKDITWYGTQTTYRYSATYNYCLSINLGLIRREAADTATEKDLTEATVVVNGKVIKYKFNSAIDLESDDWSDLLLKQIAVADEELEYSLNLYSSDYYYRASIYDDTEVGDALSTFYSSIGLSTKSTELQIYLTYTINVYNESETYDVVVNEVADYYDDTFELIENSDESKTYVQTLDGVEVNTTMNLADESSITFYDSNGNVVKTISSVSWTQSEAGITGSDGVSYNKIVTSEIGDTTIEAGGRAEIQLTFKVEKDTSSSEDAEYGAVEDITDCITLGAKHNVAEVTSFSTYNSTKSKNKWSNAGDLAGRVDEDSAPDNINIKELNEKSWYEDDTDSAPIITIELYDTDREVNGLVWEDSQTSTIEYSQTVGDGIYNIEDGDTVISGLTTELIEVISVPTGETDADGNAIYEEYEFIWPTSETLSFLGNHTLEDLTGFDSTTTTNSSGEYVFSGMSAGNYKVRFVYGDTKILTGNEDYEVVYNGQDYKSTSYQVGFDNDSDDDGYVDNDWQDLSNSDLASSRVSDARDSEARRVYISSKSEILTYTNTSLLATADENSSSASYYDELFGDYEGAEDKVTGSGYYMYAETAKLNLEVENIYNVDSTTEDTGISVVAGQSTKGNISNVTYTYTINNIDFGLEERSQTKLTLDKQIKEIIVTTSDGNVILDAVYNISYELGDDDTIKSIVELDSTASVGTSNLQSLNRSTSTQGYRYVMIDSTVLQGTTLTAVYQLTVFNVGEADTSNYSLTELWEEMNSEGYVYDADNSDDVFNKVLSELTSPYHTAETRLSRDYSSTYQYGSYLGNIYYLGTDGTYFTENNTDAYGDYIVLAETTVHQIIDYVDPDVEFVSTDNLNVDQSWTTTSIEYLVQNGLIDPSAIVIVDEDGIPVVDTNEDGTVTVRTYANYSADTSNGQSYAIMNSDLQQYIITDENGNEVKNNVVINIDDGSNSGESGTNPGLIKATIPYSANNNYDEATASITLQVSKYFSSESDGDDIDNIAEIIKVENTVGRRDVRTIAGNTVTYQLVEGATGYDETVDIYSISGEEADVSATEVITLSPPTGIEISALLIVQILAVVLVAAVIVLVGIIVIKKKVLVQ